MEDDLKICAYAAPFLGASISEVLQESFAFINWWGLEKSGVTCQAPPRIAPIQYRGSQDPDYFCYANETAFDFPGWDPKYFNSLCRPWYKLAKSKPGHWGFADLYLLNNNNKYGTATCCPILGANDEETGEPEFVGATCTAIQADGPLSEYFDIG